MAAVPPDYDSDPERWRSMDRSWQVFGDVHEPVAERLAALGAHPVIDVGGGQGRLVRALPAGITGIVVDNSRAQLTDAFGPRLLADARPKLEDRHVGPVDAQFKPDLILMLRRHSGLDPAAYSCHVEITWLLGRRHTEPS